MRDLRELREKTGEPLEVIAALAELHPSTVARLEAGQTVRAEPETVRKLAGAYGISTMRLRAHLSETRRSAAVHRQREVIVSKSKATAVDRTVEELAAEVEALRRRVDPEPQYRRCDYCHNDEPEPGGQLLDGRWLGSRCKARYYSPDHASAAAVLDARVTEAMQGNRSGRIIGAAEKVGYEGGPIDVEALAPIWDGTFGRRRRIPTTSERQAAAAEQAARAVAVKLDEARRRLARARRDMADAQARERRALAELAEIGEGLEAEAPT